MASITILLGNVGKDPEVRYAKSGTAIATFSLATTENVKVGEEWAKKTSWHNIVCFGKTAEAAEKFLSKGDKCYVEGVIDYQQWDKDGVTHYKTVITANKLEFLGGKKNQGEDPPDNWKGNKKKQQDDFDTSEIPF